MSVLSVCMSVLCTVLLVCTVCVNIGLSVHLSDFQPCSTSALFSDPICPVPTCWVNQLSEIWVGNSVANPDPGSGAFCDPWIRNPGWVKSRIRIRDEQPGSYFLELRNNFFGVQILQFFDTDPGSGWRQF
jgi:hypothetical protein